MTSHKQINHTKRLSLRLASRGIATALAATAILWASNATAADTTEEFDVGATDFEMSLGYEGIGLDKYQGAFGTEATIGYGIAPGFSASVGFGFEANEYMYPGESEISMGLFGNVVNTDNFDLDLMLGASAPAGGIGGIKITPGLELNFDLEPDLALWGLYARAELPISGRSKANQPNEYELNPNLETTVGTYYTINDRMQLLLEFDTNFKLNTLDGEDTTEIGGLALGFNVGVTDSIELITEAKLDIPQKDEKVSAGLMVGFIGTLPSVGAGN